MEEMKRIYHLDPKVRVVWLIRTGGIILLLLLLLVLIITPFTPIKEYTFWIALILLAISIAYAIWLELHYQEYTYEFYEDKLRIKRGIINKERINIPYDKIQNVNIKKDIMERLFGLATVRIETAGTSPGEAEGIIEGIGNYKAFTRYCMEMAEETRKKTHVGRREATEKGTSYLKEILKEMKELKRIMMEYHKPIKKGRKK
ncbi:PH domain-containing protein [Candidatus Micrarchaeota archaeon]|nr:PH domain-containing protein [Candidatus Micrarchaeota archaeon]